MVSWYKHYIPEWMDGTESLSDGAYRAYHVICELIYLNEGPIARNERGIAGRCNQPLKTFRKNLEELLVADKLTDENGRLSNDRAELELGKIGENRINAGKGGEKSGETRKGSSKLLKSNELGEASLRQDRSLLDETSVDVTKLVPTIKENARENATALVETLLHEGWKPSPEAMSKGKALGLSDEDLSKMLNRFVPYYVARGQTRADWNAQFGAWCIDEAKKLGKSPLLTVVKSDPTPLDPRWAPIKARLISIGGPEAYLAWFADLAIVELGDEYLRLAVKSKFVKSRLEGPEGDHLRQAVKAVHPEIRGIEFLVQTKLDSFSSVQKSA